MTTELLDDDRLLTVKEVAARLGLSETEVRNLIRDGSLRALRYTPGTRVLIRVTPQALREHIEATTAPRRPTALRVVR